MRCCENCGWLSVNPSGAMFCGYSDQRTWKDECCMAWKDKDEPKTNADRIRSMSDEELAELFAKKHSLCPVHMKELCAGMVSVKKCVMCWLDWLRQEANE